jgi:alkylation response protein AidB-like acyl-CoA dehydrogenase
MFDFTDEQKMVQKMIRRWAEKELAPHVPALEANEMLPYDLMRTLAKTFGLGELVKGYFKKAEKKRAEGGDGDGEQVGALGGDPAWSAILSMELARVCPGFMLSMGASAGLAGGAIMARGTWEQKKRYALPILTFEKIGAWGMTEPGAGSDAFGGMLTMAREDGDFFVLNGQKAFITNSTYADTLVIYAKIDRKDGTDIRSRHVHGFILERGMDGLHTPPPMKKMGMHTSPTGEIFLEDCRVPKENLLGTSEKTTARKQVKGTFQGERTGMIPMCLGIIERCIDDSVAYAKERKTWGQPIGNYQLIQDKLARMFMHRQNVRNLLFQQIHAAKTGTPMTEAQASACKLYCGRVTTEIGMEAVQLMGGNGYMQEYHVEMLARDAKLLQIGGGTDEMQITRVARSMLSE